MGRGPYEFQSTRGGLKDLTPYTHKVKCVDGSLISPAHTLQIGDKYYRIYPEGLNKPVTDAYIQDNKQLIHVKYFQRCSLTGTYFNPLRHNLIIYDDKQSIMFNPFLHYIFISQSGQIKAYSSVELMPEKGLVRRNFNNVFYYYYTKGAKPGDRVLEKLSSYCARVSLQTHANKNNATFNLTQKLYENYKVQKNNRILYSIGHLFPDYTFGCEFELANYTFELPEVVSKCLTPLKESSIGSRGMELATPVLTGYKGLSYLLEISELIRRTSVADTNCAFHIHIGAQFKRDEIVALYYLYTRIQSEISAFLLNYLKDPVAIGRKQKNYSESIPSILDNPPKDIHLMQQSEYREYVNTSFMRIATLVRGKETSKIHNRQNYILTGVPWEETYRSASRYYNLNLYNYFFTGVPTVEIRSHQGTTSPYRIMHFALIQLAIVKYSKIHTIDILNLPISRNKITLEDIIKDIYASIPSLVSYLLAYITEEKSKRTQELIASIDVAHTTAGGTQARNSSLLQRDNEIIQHDYEYKFENAFDLLCLKEPNMELWKLLEEKESSDQGSRLILMTSSLSLESISNTN